MKPITDRSPIERAELGALAHKLDALMKQTGMSQSDLARAIWGTTTDTRGRDVARNRDRISHYLRGLQMPEPKTLQALAGVFGVSVDDLIPAPSKDGRSRGLPAEVSMILLAGGSGLATIEVRSTLPVDVATQIVALVSAARRKMEADMTPPEA